MTGCRRPTSSSRQDFGVVGLIACSSKVDTAIKLYRLPVEALPFWDAEAGTREEHPRPCCFLYNFQHSNNRCKSIVAVASRLGRLPQYLQLQLATASRSTSASRTGQPVGRPAHVMIPGSERSRNGNLHTRTMEDR